MPQRLSTRLSQVPPSRASRRAVSSQSPTPTHSSPYCRSQLYTAILLLSFYIHSISRPSLKNAPEQAAEAVKQAVPETTGEAKGQANEMAGKAKGKANELTGEAKGKAAELQGEANKKM
jgi:cell division septum initiation protein DivIVA